MDSPEREFVSQQQALHCATKAVNQRRPCCVSSDYKPEHLASKRGCSLASDRRASVWRRADVAAPGIVLFRYRRVSTQDAHKARLIYRVFSMVELSTRSRRHWPEKRVEPADQRSQARQETVFTSLRRSGAVGMGLGIARRGAGCFIRARAPRGRAGGAAASYCGDAACAIASKAQTAHFVTCGRLRQSRPANRRADGTVAAQPACLEMRAQFVDLALGSLVPGARKLPWRRKQAIGLGKRPSST